MRSARRPRQGRTQKWDPENMRDWVTNQRRTPVCQARDPWHRRAWQLSARRTGLLKGRLCPPELRKKIFPMPLLPASLGELYSGPRFWKTER